MSPGAQPLLAMIGAGRMGGNMLRRLARAGISVTGFDASPTARASLAGERGLTVVASLEAAIATLTAPRAVWIMLPAGEITEQAVASVATALVKQTEFINFILTYQFSTIMEMKLKNKQFL